MQKTVKHLIQLGLLLILVGGVVSSAFAGSHKKRLQGPINEPQDVTRQCLKCHKGVARDFMKTSHWNWSLEQEVDGKMVDRGKRNSLNNYCTSTAGNEQFCAKCHAGYGLTDAGTYDFGNAENIDCLVCHDTTGTYNKGSNMAGYPLEKVNLLRVAQNVGSPNRDNCGQCHFYGGGADAVKHGDLDSSMSYPDRKTDVHMDVDGNDFQCIECHKTEDHLIAGHSLGVSPDGHTKVNCEQCHEGEVHEESRLSAHLDSVACQTCHIPVYAKNLATKIWWDWSKAGEERPFDEKDEHGYHTYVKEKGKMKYGMNLAPEYRWFNGKGGAYSRGDKIDPRKVTSLACPIGDIADAKAKIYPFKVMRGKQIYDAVNMTLVTAKITNEGGYWVDYDWNKAARLGSEASGLPYSGKYGFAETNMYWRLNHMVSPKEQALGCLDCHGDNGRMDWVGLGYKGDPMSRPEWARGK
ncbi:MAG: tetrathionate reductase family octaheme c-type cytochrome [Chloroflexi bacterium]|nr:tetrathionate reductase family octaheme c-type cytochrome [Chloroflexota bacterium]